MKKITEIITVEGDALIFEKNTNFFTKKYSIKVYLQENLYISHVEKEGNLTKGFTKPNPNPPQKEFLYEIKGKQSDIFNFVKLIKSDFEKRSKHHNYTSILYY